MYGFGPHAGFTPYAPPRPRARTGVSLLPAAGAAAQGLRALGQFATAQGGNPAMVQPPSAALRGTREWLGFSIVLLAGTLGDTGVARATSQGIFRPEKTVITQSQGADVDAVGVTTILVGSETAMVNTNAVSATVFTATSVECGVTYPTANPGITIEVNLVNFTSTTTTVRTQMVGAYIRGGGFEIGG